MLQDGFLGIVLTRRENNNQNNNSNEIMTCVAAGKKIPLHKYLPHLYEYILLLLRMIAQPYYRYTMLALKTFALKF
jgi:hypothetical protein